MLGDDCVGVHVASLELRGKVTVCVCGAKKSEHAMGALPSLERLYLGANKISDPGVIVLSEALGNGALPNIEILDLRSNLFGDPGMIALSEAIGKGALPKCTSISLFGNPASDEAKQAVHDALKRA